MKKFTFLLLAGLLTAAFSSVSAQQQPAKCASDIILQKNLRNNPQLKADHEAFLAQLREYVAAYPSMGSREGEVKIIPVVFHVVHECGPENISRAQILDQMRVLNEDFSRNSPTLTQTPPCFRDIAADVRVEFRLATKDDMGNCSDGIVRVYSPKTNDASNENGVKGLSHWNSYKYLNIWVVKSIATNAGGIGGETLGYAQFPVGGLMSTDGLVIRHDNIGSIGTSNRVGRTATHEVGHWLGLRHIWGDALCGSDGIDDTPIAREANFGICFDDFPYHIGSQACTPDTADTCGEMFMNFMDYVNDECMSMFSIGQSAVMNGVLDLLRGNLWSASNLAATGTRDEDIANAITCLPAVDFCDNRRGTGTLTTAGIMICEGGTVTFDDVTSSIPNVTRSWAFEGGSPATSTDLTELVTYDAPGLYDVSITSTNSAGSGTAVRPDFVRVSPDNAGSGSGPFYEFLDNEADLNDFVIFNSDNSLAKWEYSAWTGFGSFGSCVRMRNFYSVSQEIDDFITPAYDISSVSSPAMTFRISGAERGSTVEDQLRVYTSTNCGQSWILRKTVSGSELVTAGQYLNEYVPADDNPSQWETIALSLNGVASQDNVRFRFQFVAGVQNDDLAIRANNNLYLDDINIGSALSIGDMAGNIGLNIFPNPGSSSTNVSFSTFETSDVTIRLYDILGKEVSASYKGKVAAGEQLFNIDLSSFATGLYTVRVDVGGSSVYRKFVKN